MLENNIIRLHNASFYAYHGVADGEQDLGAKYEVDFEAHFDFSEAAKEDNLHKTLNYEKVYELINSIICRKKFNLIETVSYRIAEGICEKFPMAKKIVVKVRKYHPPVKGVVEYVEAEVTKEI